MQNVSHASVGMPGNRLTAFEPDPQRARLLDTHMRHRLADSLRYILKQAGQQLNVSADAFGQFVGRLENAPVSPLAFSYYSDVVLAIEEDDLTTAAYAMGELVRLPPAAEGVVVTDLADPRTDGAARQFVSFIATDPSVRFDIFPPSPETSKNCRSQIDGAFQLLDRADPALAAEIRALLRQIVLADGTKDPKALTFDGASSFMLWGGILINAKRGDGAIGMAQMLVHECAHMLLFGIGADESLVRNSAENLYPSPLRADPRPMDGIYHATFVTARMYRVVRQMLESDVLSPPDREKAEADLAENRRLFNAGHETVARHGDLSPLGQSVMDGAAAYMAAAN